jgi:hypothetical protein
MKATISAFQGFRFEFVCRDANEAAHVCARSALLLESTVTSFELIPDFLIEPFCRHLNKSRAAKLQKKKFKLAEYMTE